MKAEKRLKGGDGIGQKDFFSLPGFAEVRIHKLSDDLESECL